MDGGSPWKDGRTHGTPAIPILLLSERTEIAFKKETFLQPKQRTQAYSPNGRRSRRPSLCPAVHVPCLRARRRISEAPTECPSGTWGTTGSSVLKKIMIVRVEYRNGDVSCRGFTIAKMETPNHGVTAASETGWGKWQVSEGVAYR